MKLWKHIALCAACFATISFAMPDLADAARMGGGRSIGNSSTLSRPMKAPSSGSSSFNTMKRQSTQSGSNLGGTAALPRSNSGSMLGGLFGGLLAGTMLGSLFGGGTGTAAGAGAGGGGFLSLIIYGLIGWFAYKFIRRMLSGRKQQSNSYQSPYNSQQGYTGSGYSNQGGNAWDTLRDNPSPYAQPMQDAAIPADFNQEQFLKGAKMAYTRMQASWDKRDLDDIALFATDDLMRGLYEQAQDDPQPGKTEILLVNATLLEVKKEGNYTRAAVYFDVMMREDIHAAHPEQVREVWHFVCSNRPGDSWKLDAIQQMS